jgi:hypothetical protein
VTDKLVEFVVVLVDFDHRSSNCFVEARHLFAHGVEHFVNHCFVALPSANSFNVSRRCMRKNMQCPGEVAKFIDTAVLVGKFENHLQRPWCHRKDVVKVMQGEFSLFVFHLEFAGFQRDSVVVSQHR